MPASIVPSFTRYRQMSSTRKHTSSSETTESIRSDRSHKFNPPPVATCGSFLSPYDLAYVKNYSLKLLPNKVCNYWYKRYVDVLPDSKLTYQPSEEVQKREEDIAVQHFLGPSYRRLERPHNKFAKSEREALIKRYSKLKQAEEDKKSKKQITESDDVMRVQSLRSIIAAKKAREMSMKDMFGPTSHEKKMLMPACKMFQRLWAKRQRQSKDVKRLAPNSKWHILKNPLVRKKLQALFIVTVTSTARQRFVRIIRIVLYIKRFIVVVSHLAGDTHCIFKEIRQYQADKERCLEVIHKHTGLSKRKFNPSVYNFKKEIHFSSELKLSLTSACQYRSNEMIQKVLDAMQQVRSFVAYPPAYQKLLVTAAWFIVVPAYRVVIRQFHEATNYYIIITGRVKVEQLVGSPHHSQPSEFKLIGHLQAQDSFGEECITKPGSLREWTVTTETVCEMLAVTCHEFQELILKSPKQEGPPEHIRFLGSLSFMRKFPKLKLLDECLSNINVAHFLNGSVLTTNLGESKYVYVVFYGTCDVMKEIPPSPDALEAYGEWRKSRSRGKSVATERASGGSQDKHRPSAKSEVKPSERLTKTTIVSSYFDGHRDYIEGKPNLQNVLRKELEKRQNEYLTYRHAFLAESHEIEEKCRQLSRTLTGSARKQFFGQKRQRPSTPTEEVNVTRVQSTMTKHPSVIIEGRDESATVLPHIDTHVNYDRHLSTAFVNEERPRERTRQSSAFPKVVGSNISIMDAVFKQPTFAPVDSKADDLSTIEQSLEDESQTNFGKHNEKLKHSQWTIVKTAIRGDVVGTEYLDFKVGPFEAPSGIWSVVSRGATIIMIKKEFILKYLLREW